MAFLKGATVKDLTGGNLYTKPTQYNTQGVPVVNVFNYPGATGVSFAGPDSSILDSCGVTGAHFHFHTAPLEPHKPSEMFDNLLRLVGATGSLSLGNASQLPTNAGVSLPTDIDPEELDLERSNFTSGRTPFADTASCAGGSIASGDS